MLWFVADTHFFHGNIIKHENRPWSTVEDMNEGLLRNINETVGLNDTLYVLGDFSFKEKQAQVWELRKRIICRNVHLVRGNHDCGWNGTNAFRSVSDYLEIKHGTYKLVLCHYPFESWNGSYRGWSIHLHGHSHNDAEYNLANIEAGLLRFDVGVDANSYYPVSIEKVLDWAEMAKEHRRPQP